ncbi:hypothetical protein [Elizabethkingia anophelis]|uniref:hypothetical protein n=1 Tax=Elizabethkingia anophelis TaxID=1117645 RepID=UPI0015929E51|nr:hypothetical protein [Elizabethkingia anophelis]
MRKKILFAPLWGIFALSLLSSCRTEDGAITQKQLEDKRFNVFVQNSSGDKIDYANGFAYLMKRADELHKSNISGINNKTIIGTLASAGKNTSAFQDTEPYIEFNIRSETMSEKNGDKWLVFPKVQGNKVIALVLAYLSNQETKVNYYTYGEQTPWFKENVLVYQNALNKLQKRNVLSLNASIKLMANNGVPCPPNTVPDPTGGCMRLSDIDGVIITVKGPANSGLTSIDGGSSYDSGGSYGYGCEYYNSCYPTPPVPPLPQQKIDYERLKDFPCAYALAQQLTNEKIGGDLARLLKETFGANERVNISFQTSDNKFLGESVTGGFRFTGDANNFNGTVYLNKDRLSNATQDFLLSTMYHEVLHGYLNYERSRIGETEFNNQYPAMESYDVKFGDGTTMKKFLFIGTDQNHNRMGPFIDGIKQAVLNFDPSYPAGRAEALAMGGIIAESALPPAYRGISSHEADGSTAALGKRCSN